jgi:hypothetical protein
MQEKFLKYLKILDYEDRVRLPTKIFLCYLLERCIFAGTFSCEDTMAHMAAARGVSVRQISRYISQLVRCGFIYRDIRRVKDRQLCMWCSVGVVRIVSPRLVAYLESEHQSRGKPQADMYVYPAMPLSSFFIRGMTLESDKSRVIYDDIKNSFQKLDEANFYRKKKFERVFTPEYAKSMKILESLREMESRSLGLPLFRVGSGRVVGSV